MGEQDLLGSRVGHIRIVDFLGEGGMGAVYVGFDEKLQRRVALKGLREGRLDDTARARFLREARVLSQLKHPHICEIYDYVEGEDRDFLVLELVEGQSLKQVMGQRPGYAPQLRIALQVAEVLAAAHSKGIIHRDLKPSNVLITREGDVKVLDFGLARPTDEYAETLDATDPSALSADVEISDYVVTRLGALVGTLAYMSPEQARGEPLTTASDMYSYGLVTQELFTGRPAYEPGLDPARHLEKARAGESVPVTGLPADLTTLINRLKSRAQAVRPSAVDTVERLGWIRDRPRRRLRRLAGLAALGLAVLVAAGMTYQAWRVEQEADRANREAEAARQVSDFLVGLFAVSDPSEARGNTVTAREILEKGASRIEDELADQPLVQARLMDTMGAVHEKLGLYARARELLEKALRIREELLPDDDLTLAETHSNLATLLYFTRDYDEAALHYQRALEIRLEVLGDDDPLVATTRFDLGSAYHMRGDYERAEGLYQRALEVRERVLGPDHTDVAASLINFGGLYHDRGDAERAAEYYQRALALREQNLGPDHPALASPLVNLGCACLDMGRYDRAESSLARALNIRERVLGPEHPEVALTLQWLAELSGQTGEYQRAQDLSARALDINEKVFGPEHAVVGRTRLNLARHCNDARDHRRARELATRVLRTLERAEHSDDETSLASSLIVLGRAHLGQREYAEAQAVLERARSLLERTGEPEEPSLQSWLAQTEMLLGRANEALGRRDQAQERWDRAVDLMTRVRASSRERAHLYRYTEALLLAGRIEDARPAAEGLIAGGYRDRDFVELCRTRGLRVPEEAEGM